MTRESVAAAVLTAILGIALLWILKSAFEFLFVHIWGLVVLMAIAFTVAGIFLYLNQRRLGAKNH
ncbi:MAG: hypothetical protein WB973_00655 [Thermoanaerobaculia bacterium]